MEFKSWESIPRMSKEKVFVTEKIDGSNAAIRIRPFDINEDRSSQLDTVSIDGEQFTVWAQSRTRFLGPTKETDNFGFGRWVYDNAPELVKILGPGDHYGEWWGSKIQRGYGLTNGERKFSLFNASRWYEVLHHTESRSAVDGLLIVPTLYNGRFYDFDVKAVRDDLVQNGSKIVRGFKAEGMIVYLRELGKSYKVLLDNDEIHKWQVDNESTVS